MSREFKKPEGAMPSLRFIKPSQLAAEGVTGTVLEGEYVGAVKNAFDEGKEDFKFLTDDGNTVIVNSTGSLAYQMKLVKIGDYVQLNYMGKEKIAKGKMKGKEAHKFEVLVA